MKGEVMNFFQICISREEVVAAGYPVSIRTLCELHKSRKLRGTKLGNQIYYRRCDVDAFFCRQFEDKMKTEVANDNTVEIRSDAVTKKSGRRTKAEEVAKRRSLQRETSAIESDDLFVLRQQD